MKLRHYFITTYLLIAAIAILITLKVIPITWFEFSSFFAYFAIAVVLYFISLYIWYQIESRRRKKRESELELEFEVTFFCHGCAKPLPEPTRHPKGAQIFHKNCIQ